MLNQEHGKYPALSTLWEHAKSGRCRILTSTISMVEVIKKKHDDQNVATLTDQPSPEISKMFQQKHVVLADLDRIVAEKAAELRLQHPELRKTPDAVHLATAIQWNCDALHTYDKNDLLTLNGKIHRRDGAMLEIATADKAVLGPLFIQSSIEDTEQS